MLNTLIYYCDIEKLEFVETMFEMICKFLKYLKRLKCFNQF